MAKGKTTPRTTVAHAIKITEQLLGRKVKLIDSARLTGNILVVVTESSIKLPANVGKGAHWERRVDTYCGTRQLHSSIAESWFENESQ